ncbi:MAG: exo-alpha-sialidase [Bacteroidetes bacterium]|nr:exo-alpha-sialidase [Bacteroidota bacterium]
MKSVLKEIKFMQLVQMDIYTSPSDYGNTWSKGESIAVGGSLINEIFIKNRLLLIGTMPSYSGGYTLFKSTDDGHTWNPANNGIPLYNAVYCLLQTNDTMYSAGANGIYISLDSGNNWSDITSNLSPTNIISLAKNNNTLFIGESNSLSYRISKSNSNGTSWTSVYTSPSPIYTLLTDGNDIYAGTGNGVVHSADNGINWSTSGMTGKGILCLFKSGTKLFAGTSLNGLYESTNGGGSWTVVSGGIPVNTSVYNLALEGSKLLPEHGQKESSLRPTTEITGSKETHACVLMHSLEHLMKSMPPYPEAEYINLQMGEILGQP